MALYVATENMLYYGIAMGIGFAIYFLQEVIRKRRPASSSSDDN
jgi:hypothetical protein